MVVKTFKNSRTTSLVPLPPVGMPTVRSPTEAPALDGQDVGDDFDVGISDEESWSAVGSPRAGDEGAKMDADTGSGG